MTGRRRYLVPIAVVGALLIGWGVVWRGQNGDRLRSDAAGAPVQAQSQGRGSRVDALLARMSLAEKVGQMVMAGFPGTELGPEARRLIEEAKVGGVILMGRNLTTPAQVAGLTADLQALARRSGARAPLLIATDQETGEVGRLPEAAPFPGAMALGAAGSVELAQAVGQAVGEELAAVGINMDFAPVLDVNLNPENPVIGVRSFGESPDAVARLGAAFARGLAAGGVIATGKHFPGHGDTGVDSHIELPTVTHSAAQLQAIDLKPFTAAIGAGVDAIMTAHVTVPAIDSTPALPATLSRPILTGLLREQMGFEGLIVTDAMEMGAIVNRFGAADAAVRAVQAGADMVLIAWPKEWTLSLDAAAAILAAVRDGRIPEAGIDRSVARILSVKEAHGLFAAAPLSPAKAAAVVTRAADRDLARRAAAAAVTLVRDRNGLVPLSPAKAGRILVVEPQVSALTGVEERQGGAAGLAGALGQRFENVKGKVVSLKPTAEERAATLAAARAAETVVVATYRAWSGAYQAQAELVKGLLGLGKPLIVVSLREPYDLARFPQAGSYVAAYGSTAASLAAVADLLAGKIAPQGRLPVRIPGLFAVGDGIRR